MAKIVVLEGEFVGQSFPLNAGVTTFGRVPGNDVVLPNASVSSNHSKIEQISGNFVLVDLDSTNGTFVNNARITTAELSRNDVIRFGDVVLTIKGDDVPGDDDSTAASAVIDNIPRSTVVMTPRHATTKVDVDGFGKKNDHKAAWFTIITILSVIVAVLLAVFVYSFYAA